MIGIYKITSPSGKIYIGQSKDIEKRFYSHRKQTEKQNTKFGLSIKEHGINNHSFEILEICNEDELNERELYYIRIFKSNILGLNTNLPLSKLDNNSKNGKIQISVQCLNDAKLIKEVRNYAKQRTIEELKKEEKL
jgi:group I intron endonuclease